MFKVGDRIKAVSLSQNKSYNGMECTVIGIKRGQLIVRFDDGHEINGVLPTKFDPITPAQQNTVAANQQTSLVDLYKEAYKDWLNPKPKEEPKKKSDGCCPQCGEAGKYINLAPVCSKHGIY